MPIKRLQKETYKIPTLGKLRKGDEKRGDKPGQELSHWRFTSNNGDIERAFIDEFGKEPQSINVLLPYSSVEDNWETWQEAWLTGGLQHRCDGETTVLLLKNGIYTQQPHPCPKGCKEVGRLTVIIPALLKRGYVGTVTMETHSINDILSIDGSLYGFFIMRPDMRGVEFDLRRVLHSVSTPSQNGKRVRREKWMVEIIPHSQWVVAQLGYHQRQALAVPDMPALPPPQVIIDEDGVIYEDEDTPENDWDNFNDNLFANRLADIQTEWQGKNMPLGDVQKLCVKWSIVTNLTHAWQRILKSPPIVESGREVSNQSPVKGETAYSILEYCVNRYLSKQEEE